MPSEKKLTILFYGDIVGKPGRRAVAAVLPDMRKELQPDLVIANAENLAHGVGVTRKTLEEMRVSGIDFFTSGNHIWSKPEVYDIFQDPSYPLLRPANYGPETPGRGYQLVPVGHEQVLVVNLHGQVFIEEELDNPFHALDAILDQVSEPYAGVLVDFHAEATSEKSAFGWHADGRVSAVLGTHTHVPTADERILPRGTAFISDVGMCGLHNSVIGVNTDIILDKFLQKQSRAHDIADHGDCIVNAVLVTIDPQTKKATSITRHQKFITI